MELPPVGPPELPMTHHGAPFSALAPAWAAPMEEPASGALVRLIFADGTVARLAADSEAGALATRLAAQLRSSSAA